jgi:hypothetical protein
LNAGAALMAARKPAAAAKSSPRAAAARASSGNDEALDAFVDTLWLEDGLSRNTLESYRRDVRQFGEWLGTKTDKALLAADHGDIQAYLGHRFALRARASSASIAISCAAGRSPRIPRCASKARRCRAACRRASPKATSRR